MAKKDKDRPEAYFIPAGAVLGVGFGLLLGNVAAYVLIGVGIGFLLMAIFGLFRKKR